MPLNEIYAFHVIEFYPNDPLDEPDSMSGIAVFRALL
jgi:hypothetical protein